MKFITWLNYCFDGRALRVFLLSLFKPEITENTLQSVEYSEFIFDRSS